MRQHYKGTMVVTYGELYDTYPTLSLSNLTDTDQHVNHQMATLLREKKKQLLVHMWTKTQVMC